MNIIYFFAIYLEKCGCEFVLIFHIMNFISKDMSRQQGFLWYRQVLKYSLLLKALSIQMCFTMVFGLCFGLWDLCLPNFKELCFEDTAFYIIVVNDVLLWYY